MNCTKTADDATQMFNAPPNAKSKQAEAYGPETTAAEAGQKEPNGLAHLPGGIDR